ncbi:MAG: diacylglycerol kinase family protein [Mycobacteriales bacterium]
MRALLVVNPKATATTERMRDVLTRALASQAKLDVVQTEARGHATSLARQAVVDGLDVVVALGGDGTVNEVVNGLLADGPAAGLPALAVVPGGSTNVFARALGLPASPVEATSQLLDALREDRRRSIGLGQADERWFTFCAGLGMDADVVRRVERKRAAGHKATPGLFVRQGLRQFFLHGNRSEPALTLHADGRPPERIGLALVCNSDPWTYLGSRPVRPCPHASFDDGLDLFGLRTLGTLSTLRHLRQILSRRARPRGRSVLSLHDATGFRLTADRPAALQVDGDDLGDRTDVIFRAVPDALDVLA